MSFCRELCEQRSFLPSQSHCSALQIVLRLHACCTRCTLPRGVPLRPEQLSQSGRKGLLAAGSKYTTFATGDALETVVELQKVLQLGPGFDIGSLGIVNGNFIPSLQVFFRKKKGLAAVEPYSN